MKRNFVWGFGFAVLMALAIWGCEDKEPGKNIWDPGPPLMQITLLSDTLTFLPGDTAVCFGSVTVTDGEGAPYPNLKIDLSLAQPICYIEFLDSERRDTTDEVGQVHFRYNSYGFEGTNAIRAAAWNRVEICPFLVRSAGIFRSLQVSISEDSCSATDSVEICARIFDDLGNCMSIPGIMVPMRVGRGHLNPYGSMENACGCCTWWHPDDCLDRCCFPLTVSLFSNDVCITVD